MTRVDLDDDSRRALEFDALLDWVAGHARTALGAERVRACLPAAEPEEVAGALEEVAEAVTYLGREGALIAASLPDPRQALAGLAIASLRLAPEQLRNLAKVGEAAGSLRRHVESFEPGAFPRIRARGEALPDLVDECREVLAGIGAEGRLEDGASPELARIRRSIRRNGERLKSRLESILRDPGQSAVIQDDFITQRNGRYVIPVRTDAPKPLEGIVHASSSSGATRFVEPLESVELNNERVRLTEEERLECERILLAWTDRFRERRGEVEEMVEAVAAIDELQARALFARETGGEVPEISEGERLLLRKARHPLLARHLAETGGTCVPLDLELDPADQVLVVSGPNTGGKTVALKTLGLASLMTQSGIPFPAERVVLPLYRQVRADIGDHQSIEADLSTYSAHMRAVISILENPAAPGLFLFDEIGSGTEPTEGAALARAILDDLGRAGITVVATTHLAPLKAWALERERAVCAAMEFDPESLRPTYRLLVGAPGTSAGLDIAGRLGLAPRIVQRARESLGPANRQSETYVERLRALVVDAEHRREELERERAEFEEERARLTERFAREQERTREQMAREVEAALAALRREGEKELRSVRERKERLRLEKGWAKAESRLAARAKQARSSIAPETREEELLPVETPGVGDAVHVTSLGRDARIERVAGERVDVLLGGMTFTVDVADLRRRPAAASEAGAPRETRSAHAPAVPARELMLLGKTGDEARPAIDRYLEDCLVAGVEEVRIVHGHGTGRLKAEVRRYLGEHALVASHRPGGKGEGGDGATVAKLK